MIDIAGEHLCELKLLGFPYHRKRILNSLSPRSLMCCIQRNRRHHCRGLVRAAHLRNQFSGRFHAKFSYPHNIIIVASSFEAPSSKPTACPSLFRTIFRLFLEEFDGLSESNSAFPQCGFIGLVYLVALAFVDVLVALLFVAEPVFVLLSLDVIPEAK